MQNRVNLVPHFEECSPSGNCGFNFLGTSWSISYFELFQAFQLAIRAELYNSLLDQPLVPKGNKGVCDLAI